MLRLAYTLGGEPRTYPLDRERVTVGRMLGNDLILPDHTISRNHAELESTPSGWKIVDLNSRNGTWVNDVLVKDALLAPGCTITLGRFQLRLEEVDELNKQLLAPTALPEKAALAPADVDLLARRSRILAVLSQVSRTLLSAGNEVEDVLEEIMDVIFQHVRAQRGAILLVNPTSGDLEPRTVRQAGDQKDTIQISRTIATKAVEEGVAILTQDAMVDPRFDAGESIAFLGIHSALCVPMKLGETVMGLIYVDNPVKVKAYDEFDLDLLSALSGYAALAIQQARLRAAVEAERLAKSRLERYHSPSVVNQILTASEQSGGFSLDVREVEASLLFADLVGFTTLTENMPPRDVALMLNAYFSRMTDVIFRYEGTLDKYMGDALMAIFGAPLPSDDHARRAVRCALEMRRELDRFNDEHADAPKLNFRIGVNSGPVVAGDIGSLRRMEYSVLGTTVNVASRLQSEVAEPGQIVVGEATYKKLGGGFEFEPLGKVKVKGLTKPILAFTVHEGAKPRRR
jgi:adenylate cyclase